MCVFCIQIKICKTNNKFLNETGKKYYTYQLKSTKGLQVVLEGIEPYSFEYFIRPKVVGYNMTARMQLTA